MRVVITRHENYSSTPRHYSQRSLGPDGLLSSIYMSTENDDFNVDLTFSGQSRSHSRLIGALVAIATIVFIVLTMATNIASNLLPMSDEYLAVLIPLASDGAEPLSLKSLQHEINDKTISVHGTVANRTDYPVSNIVAVVEMQETTGRFPQTVEVPIQPAELQPNATGEFMASATLMEKPGAYLVKFRIADGPFFPHKDDRGITFGVAGQ